MSAPPYTTTRLGKLYQGDPLPVVVEATTYYPAGAVTFGVEGRALFEEGDDAPWAGGPTLHVFETGSGAEHLRFDAFPGEEHYHYLTPGVQNHWVGFDTVADGQFVDWLLDRVRTKLPDLLRFAGAAELAAQVDPHLIGGVLDDVEKHLRSRELRLEARSDGSITADEVVAQLDAGGELALLDVRERGVIADTGTLLLAASIPLSELEFRVRRFVPRLGTPIVLIDDEGGPIATAAQRILRKLGYTSVRLLTAGAKGWIGSGREVYTSVQALGQSFGEFLERAEGTPHATVAEVQALVDAGEDVLFLDSRPIDEFVAHSLPQGISVPGAEIVSRGIELITSPDTVVVVNCAGRTRSIVGAQALINAGVTNRVIALEGGTMSWSLEGRALAHGLHREAPAPSDPGGVRHAAAAALLFDRFGITRIDWAEAQRRTADSTATTYLVDVRTPAEYDADHVEGSISTPSWDIAPWVFRHLATLNATIVVIDDGVGLRAALTGSWFVQLGWSKVAALLIDDVPEQDRAAGAEPATFTPAVAARLIEPADLHASISDFTIVDVARSDLHAAGHVPGARFATRSALAVSPNGLPGTGPIAVTSPDGKLAELVAADLADRIDRPVVAVRGGTAAWQDAGLTLESALHQPISEVDDLALSPWQQADQHAAFREYLRWEIALVDQLDRDDTTPFVAG